MKAMRMMNTNTKIKKIKRIFSYFSIYKCIEARRKYLELVELMRNEKECLICLEMIDETDWTTCINCNIFLHKGCEEKYRANKGYCKCPYCMKIGTMDSPQCSTIE